jgi:hypothetical protein
MCFELSTWSQGEVGQIPGDPLLINRDGKCKLFERSVQPDGLSMLWFRIRNFLRRFR